ncbi:MAG: YegS/Rv2252/BmrU family lipid kinase [Clostridia bacterium]|nr:YegS/Rv2252/BmrU family lipid kinase [Clostridia bacterium]
MNKKAIVIYNPICGKNSTRYTKRMIQSSLSALPLNLLFYETAWIGHATEIVKNKCAEADLILCCGGDGTYNEVVNGVIAAGAQTPIVLIPMGSTNDLALTLGIPTEMRNLVQLMHTGRFNRFDVGRFNDRCFAYVATFGVGTSISFETSQKMKNLLGYNAYMVNAYFLKTIPTLKDIKPRHARIEYDGQIIEDDFYFGAISNTISVAGMFQLDPEKVDLHDGKFELLLVRRVKRPTDAFSMLQKIRRKEYDNDSILLLQAENIKMTFDKPQDWSLDGEFCGGVTDVDFSVLPKAIRVLSPENALLKEKEESAISGEA